VQRKRRPGRGNTLQGRKFLRASTRPFRKDELVEAVREFVQTLKRENPFCTDCEYQWPVYVLEFDHVDPSTKLFNVGDAYAAPSLEALVEEIEKCELVCSNCHKIREFERRRPKT
jgi:hypothetical protein